MSIAHEQLRALIEQALDLETTEEREQLLAACLDPELAEEARVLLGLQTQAERLDQGAARLRELDENPALPAQIGPYRILGLLGTGGMGAVYHGVRDDGSFRKDVAIKVVRDVYSSEQRMRFARERELLARLEHPAIARILDGGTTEAGQPWMAIERVDGLPLDQYVRDRELSLRERIALMVRIADAVQFAHQNLIVHRDLKPSNVLVQADGKPKLLDFGVAKLLGEVEHTQTAGRAPMTFAYAAPEQIRGDAVTTATDVYALGVMLYELLTGERPHKIKGENSLSLLQAITDTDATAPSESLRRRGSDTSKSSSVNVRELRGDLDTIVLKALSRDPVRRYVSAQALREDLDRYLTNRPIQARPDSFGYRARKWVRRNRVGAAVGSLVALGIAMATALIVQESNRAIRSAELARSALTQARGTQEALARVFAAGNPAIAGRPEVAFRDVLASALSQLRDMPAQIRLPVQYTVALAQAQIGDTAAAVEGFAEAARIAQSLGNGRARAQAELRQITLAIDLVSAEASTQAIETLIVDPQLALDPVLRSGSLITAARIAGLQFRSRSAARHIEAARIAWQAVVPSSLPLDDASLAAELEIERYLLEIEALAYGIQGSQDASSLAAALLSVYQRLAPRMPVDHPRLAALRVAAQNLPNALAARTDWRAQLYSNIEAQVPRLGLTHPTIRAQVMMGIALAKLQQLEDSSMQRLQLKIARAQPTGTRLRLRQILEAAEAAFHDSGLSADEVAMARKAVCAESASADHDCVWSELTLIRLQFSEGRVSEAFARLDALTQSQEALPQSLTFRVRTTAMGAYLRAGRYDDAVAAAEAAHAAAMADPELDGDQRDVSLMHLSWGFRPQRCDRVLELLEPIKDRLARNPAVAGDVLARLMATCAVRVGGDVDVALARLAPWWQRAQDPATDPMVRLEVIKAHLEIFHVLGRDTEFARWAGELAALQAKGLDLDVVNLGHFEWFQRARRMHADGELHEPQR